MTRTDSVDVKRWRAKYALIERAAEADQDAKALFAEMDAERTARNGELREILADLVASKDLVAFKESLGHWARKDGPYVGFPPVGGPWVAALVRRAEEDHAEVVELLAAALQTPATPQAAADKLQSTPGVASNGIILIGSQDEHLYAVSPDGTLRWLLELRGDVDTTPAIAQDGTIYVAGDDGHLHAFR